MRVSCLAFARIVDSNGRHCALLNAGRLKHNNERLISPVGGGLQFKPSGLAQLKLMGAFDFEGKPGDTELRFRAPDKRVTDIERWFRTEEGREISVRRELDEELRRETGTLSREDIASATVEFSCFRTFTGETSRDVPEKMTFYIIEVDTVVFGSKAMDKLFEASNFPIEERWVYFVDDDEMHAKLTRDGVAIGDIMSVVMR